RWPGGLLPLRPAPRANRPDIRGTFVRRPGGLLPLRPATRTGRPDVRGIIVRWPGGLLPLRPAIRPGRPGVRGGVGRRPGGRLRPARSSYRRDWLREGVLQLRVRRAMGRVVLLDQRLGIGPDDPRDRPDVPAGVEVTAARRVVIALDVLDQGLPDPGPLADLGDGKAGPAARLRQGLADAHGNAPPLDRTACRPDCRVRPVMTPSSPLRRHANRSGAGRPGLAGYHDHGTAAWPARSPNVVEWN